MQRAATSRPASAALSVITLGDAGTAGLGAGVTRGRAAWVRRRLCVQSQLRVDGQWARLGLKQQRETDHAGRTKATARSSAGALAHARLYRIGRLRTAPALASLALALQK